MNVKFWNIRVEKGLQTSRDKNKTKQKTQSMSHIRDVLDFLFLLLFFVLEQFHFSQH